MKEESMFEWLKIQYWQKKLCQRRNDKIMEKIADRLEAINSIKCFVCLDEFDKAFSLVSKIKQKELRTELFVFLDERRTKFYKKRIPFFIKSAKEKVDFFGSIFNINPKYIGSVFKIVQKLGKDFEYFGTTYEEVENLYSKVVQNSVRLSKLKGEAKNAGLDVKASKVFVEAGLI